MTHVVGDEVKLRRDYGPPIVPGDVLQTRTGRQYLVREVQGRRLHCVIVQGMTKTMDWNWTPRGRRNGGFIKLVTKNVTDA